MKEFLEFNENPGYQVIFPPELDMKPEDIILKEFPRILREEELIPFYWNPFQPISFSRLVVHFTTDITLKLESVLKEYSDAMTGRVGYSEIKSYTIILNKLGIFDLIDERTIVHKAKINNFIIENDKVIGLSFYVPLMERQLLKTC